jgi:hypothetical protein
MEKQSFQGTKKNCSAGMQARAAGWSSEEKFNFGGKSG